MRRQTEPSLATDDSLMLTLQIQTKYLCKIISNQSFMVRYLLLSLCDKQFTDDDWPAGEVFVAIEKAGSSIQRVPGVINSRALWIDRQYSLFYFWLHKLQIDSRGLWLQHCWLASLGVLWAAHKKIHCSVAVIWVQVSGWHSLWKSRDKHQLIWPPYKVEIKRKSPINGGTIWQNVGSAGNIMVWTPQETQQHDVQTSDQHGYEPNKH